MGGLSKVGERLQREIDMLNSLPQTKSLSPVRQSSESRSIATSVANLYRFSRRNELTDSMQKGEKWLKQLDKQEQDEQIAHDN